MTVTPETDELIAGAATGTVPDGGGIVPSGVPGGEWGYGYTQFERRLDRQANRQFQEGWRAAKKGMYDWESFAASTRQAGIWNAQAEERAANVANLADGLQVAQRLHQLGMVYPWLPGDAAVGLAQAGADVNSPAATAAATAAAAQAKSTPQPDNPAIMSKLTPQQAEEFASVNSDLADTDLLRALMQRGWQPSAASSYVFDQNTSTFRLTTDTDVEVDLRTVLHTESELQPEEEGGGLFGFADGVMEAVRGASRWTWAALESIPQTYTGAVRANYDGGGFLDGLGALAAPYIGIGVTESYDETTFAEAVRQMGQGGNQGSGWFMGGSVKAGQDARVRAQYAGQMSDGAPSTPGRIAASWFSDPGDDAYNLMSGIADGVVLLGLDPSTYVGAGAIKSGIRGTRTVFSSTERALKWDKGEAIVDDIYGPRDPKAPEVVAPTREPGWFETPEQVPLNASQAVSLEQVTPRLFVGGNAHDRQLTDLLTAADDAEVSALFSTRRPDASNAVRIELDPAGLPGYVKTDSSVDWATEVKKGYSSRVTALENASQLRDRIKSITLGPQIPSKSKLAKTVDSLVNERGWFRTEIRRKDTGEITGYRLTPPTQLLPDGATKSPFVVQGERATVAPWALRADARVRNMTPHVYGDLDADTMLAHFPEHGAIDTTKLYDRNPLRLVNDVDMLEPEPAADLFRVRYDTTDLQGKIVTAEDAITTRQQKVVENPEQAWTKPRKPEFDEDAAREQIRRDYEAEFIDETDLTQRLEKSPATLPTKYQTLRQEAEAAVDEQINLGAARDVFPSITFNTAAQKRRFYDHGDMDLADFLREPQEWRDSLAFGPGSTDSFLGDSNALPPQHGASDGVLGNYRTREVDFAEYEAWKRGNPKEAAAERKAGWRVYEHPQAGKRWLVKMPPGVRPDRAKVHLPWMDEYTTAAMARRKNQQLDTDWGDDAEHLDYYAQEHEAKVAEWESMPDGPVLYSIEVPDPTKAAGKGEPAVGPDGLLDFAVYATRDRSKAGKAGRAVTLRWRGRGKQPRVLDLDTEAGRAAVDAAATGWFDRIVQYVGSPDHERFTDIFNTEIVQAASGTELLKAIRKADRELAAQLGDSFAATARLEDELVAGLRSGRWDAVESQDIFHALDPLKWKRAPIRADVEKGVTKTFDAESGRFTVGVSGKQEILRRAPQGIEAPMARPVSIPKEKWDEWKAQRERLIGQGWTVQESLAGRELLSRPLTGEYDKAQFDDLGEVLGRPNTQTPVEEAMGASKDGVRKFIVPQRFVNWLDTKPGRTLKEKIAAEKSYYGMRKLVGKQRPETMAHLLAAETPVQVEGVLLNAVDGGKVNALRGQGKVVGALEDMADPVFRKTPYFRRSIRDVRFTKLMPGPHVNLDNADEAIDQLEAFMVTAKLPIELRDDLMKDMVMQSHRFGRKEIFFHASKVMETHIATEMHRGWWKGSKATDIEKVARDAVTFFNDEYEKLRLYAVKAHGENAYIPGAKIVGDDLTQSSPQLMSEFLNSTLPLPDPREIKRLTGFLGRMTAYGLDTKRAKIVQNLIVAGDWFNRLFKTTALARIAYPVRVGLEEQGRLWGSGYSNMYSHPLSFIMTVSHKHYGLDVFGNKFGDSPALRADNPLHDPEPTVFAQALVNKSRMWDDPHAVRVVGSDAKVVTIAEEGYWDGWQFELGKLHNDPMARRLAGGFKPGELAAMPKEIAEASARDQVSWWLTNHAKGRDYVKAMSAADADLGYRLATPDGVQSFVDEIQARLDYATGNGDPQLLRAVGHAELQFKGKTVPMYSTTTGGFDVNNEFITSLKSFTDAPYRPNAVVYHNKRISRERGQRYDEAVGKFFYQLQGRPTNTLARSPVFREEYWRQVANGLYGGADPAARKVLMRNAEKAGVHNDLLNKMKDLDAKTGGGNLTLEDVDSLASFNSLQHVRGMLYDTHRRHQFWDSLRLVAPFGQAWHEVMTTWAKLVVQNPKVLDRVAHTVQGAQEEGSNAIYEATNTPHDPNQGFFFSDPRTGAESFAWPMPPFLNKYLTHGMPSDATGIMWAAPVGGLNLIGQMYPGFGPVITAPAMALLDGSEGEALRQFLAPFGGPSVEEAGGLGNAFVDAVTPAWLRKFATSTMPWNQEQKNQLASAQMAGMVYLMSTGKYDLENATEIDRLVQQGKTLGQRVYFLRALGQFVLPTMGAPEMAAQTADGELVLQAKLADILRQYQAEPEEGGYGYNDGFINFLRDFGSDLYLMGTSRTESAGYASPTRGTYDWMKRNPDLVRKYPEVYGLLVEDDTTAFYYPAYQLQINNGSVVMRDPRDYLEAANERIGRALYTSYRSRYGESPTDSEQAELNILQDQLQVKYVGYSPIPSTIGESDQLIYQLEQAHKDPKVAKTPLGQTMKQYFDVREQYRASGIRDFRAESGRDAALHLYQLGQSLAATNPDFVQAWEWLLQRELDVDTLGAS